MFRKKNFSKVALLLIITLTLGLFFLGKNLKKPLTGDVAVIYDGKKFMPDSVVIQKGTKVVFKNESGKDFWPASDFHPDNGVYPEFNPKKSITSGSSWDFKFDLPGEWGYHDHLAPYNRGRVFVKDRASILTGNKCQTPENLTYQDRELCWYREVKDSVTKKGVEGALSLVKKLYSEESLFGQGCHDIMHLVGDEAYRAYRKGKSFRLGQETAYCGYGFFHGFIEAMLYTTGDYSEVRRFCETLSEEDKAGMQDQNAMYACYHGIGHATFDIHDPSVWGSETKMVTPAITTCEKVTVGLSEEKIKQCATGVFNALAIAYANDQYNLKLKKEDPVWFCRNQPALYKGSCFIEVALSWLHKESGSSELNFDLGISFINNLKDIVGQKATIQAFASDITRLKIGNFDSLEMIRKCKSLKMGFIDSCILGVEEGLLLSGKPEEEYKLALSFCAAGGLTKEEKEKCFRYTLGELRVKYSKEKMKNICEKEVEATYREFCKDESN